MAVRRPKRPLKNPRFLTMTAVAPETPFMLLSSPPCGMDGTILPLGDSGRFGEYFEESAGKPARGGGAELSHGLFGSIPALVSLAGVPGIHVRASSGWRSLSGTRPCRTAQRRLTYLASELSSISVRSGWPVGWKAARG